MKRSFIIALCCFTVLLASCNKEKPNEKFIGDYEGSGLINGTMTVLNYNQEFNDIAIPMKINLAAGDDKDKVILTYINEELDETYTTTGTITNNDVDFDPVEINTLIETYEVHATLDLAGTLTGTILTMSGAVTGGGTYTDGGLSLPYTIEGNLTGNLNKIVSIGQK